MFAVFKRSLGTKITLWYSGVLIIVLGLITIINIIYQNRVLMDREHEAVGTLADSILTAVRHPMMTGDQEIVQMQFEKFKELKGIEVIHLLDHNGLIKRSTDMDLIGEKSMARGVDKALKGEEYIGVERRARIRGKVYSELKPILNEESCRSCHGQAHEVLGVLRLASDWDPVEASIVETRNRNILISLIGLVLMGFLAFVLLKVMLTKPANTLISTAGELASRAGDLTQRVKIYTQDEIGRLAEVFNRIIDSMHDMVLQIRTTADKVATSSQQLSSSTQQVNASTQEVSAAIQQISKGATTQAERVEETFDIMEKSSVSLKQVVANSQTATSGVSEASGRAQSGQAAAEETVQKISRLTNTVVSTAGVIRGLGEKSQQIGEITETITSIADQTNLLALNAAIEAARAGEAGRGFAVVAEEIRKLAEGSAEAVRRIGGLVRSIQTETNKAVGSIETSSKEVEEGKGAVAKIAETLIDINKAIQEASLLTKQISEATGEQVKGTERVVGAVNQVATIAKESVSTTEEVSSSVEEQTASMQEMSASAQELARLATELKDMVSKFKLKETARTTTKVV